MGQKIRPDDLWTRRIVLTAEGALSDALVRVMQASPIRAIAEGGLSASQYASLLHELHHASKGTRRLHVVASALMSRDMRAQLRAWRRQGGRGPGLDQLALDDLAALHYPAPFSQLRSPLDETRAITAVAIMMLEREGPVSFVGNIYFQEHLCTVLGGAIARTLRTQGMPDGMLGTFSACEASWGQSLSRLTWCLQSLATGEADLEALARAILTTGELYAAMFEAALRRSPHKPFAGSMRPYLQDLPVAGHC